MLCEACRGVLEEGRNFIGWAYSWETESQETDPDTTSSNAQTSPEQPTCEPSADTIDLPIGNLHVSRTSSADSVESTGRHKAFANRENSEDDKNEDERDLNRSDYADSEDNVDSLRRSLTQVRHPHKPAKHGHHRTISDFQKSLDDWCQVCRILWDDLSLVEQQSVQLGRKPDLSQRSGELTYFTHAYISEDEYYDNALLFRVYLNQRMVSLDAKESCVEFQLYSNTGM